MRKLFFIAILCSLAGLVSYSCKKKDPPPFTDPRLTNPYCNDPAAVNYNWGFPGKPDNAVCFYPSDLFVGGYLYLDSVYVLSTGLFISADSVYMNIVRTSDTNHRKITLLGFCSTGYKLHLTAGASFDASVDTLVGDSTTLHQGQIFCNSYDTISGSMVRDRIDSTLIHVSFKVASDTAIYSHIGTAKKL